MSSLYAPSSTISKEINKGIYIEINELKIIFFGLIYEIYNKEIEF